MNEFIVWDKETQTFHEIYSIDFLNNLCNCYLGNICLDNEGSIFPYIGKKDINDKKIYSGSSIVEFEYCYEDYGWQDFVGYFYYDSDLLQYRLKCYETNTDSDFKKGSLYVMTFEKSRTRNFKIIDTIQENKLGLIK